MGAIAFLEPHSFVEAARALAAHGPYARLVAGGTAVHLAVERGDLRPRALVGLGRVAGHDDVRQDGAGLHLGALARLRAVERSPVARAFCPALARAFGLVGNVRVRNQATVGGSLAGADVAVDPPTVLLALDAELLAVDEKGPAGRCVPLATALSSIARGGGPGGVFAGVVVPPLAPTVRAAYLKQTPRSVEARPCVTIAAVADVGPGDVCRSLRLAVGGAVAVPQRLVAGEAAAHGSVLTDDGIAAIAHAAAAQLVPTGESNEPDWYRRRMVQVFVRRALVEVRDAAR